MAVKLLELLLSSRKKNSCFKPRQREDRRNLLRGHQDQWLRCRHRRRFRDQRWRQRQEDRFLPHSRGHFECVGGSRSRRNTSNKLDTEIVDLKVASILQLKKNIFNLTQFENRRSPRFSPEKHHFNTAKTCFQLSCGCQGPRDPLAFYVGPKLGDFQEHLEQECLCF